jgi:hypothetical protein
MVGGLVFNDAPTFGFVAPEFEGAASAARRCDYGRTAGNG